MVIRRKFLNSRKVLEPVITGQDADRLNPQTITDIQLFQKKLNWNSFIAILIRLKNIHRVCDDV